MAFGKDTFSAGGGAVSDIFAGIGYDYKAKGNRLEAENYDQAAAFADENALFTVAATNVKTAQAQRSIYQTLGGQQADIAAAGFSASGSALDLMRDSAAQGNLTKAVLSAQGQITETGYKQQAASYRTMAESARLAADAADWAQIGSFVSGAIKGITAIASI